MIYFGVNGTKKQSKKAVCGVDGKKYNVVSAWANKDGKPVCIWNGTTHPKDAFMYLPCSNNNPYYSKDGKTWTKIENSTVPATASPHVLYANGKFIIPGGNHRSSSSSNLHYSADAITWTGVNFNAVPNDVAYGKVNGINYYVAVGLQGNVYYSTDLTTWTSISCGSAELVRVTYRNGHFVCVGVGCSYRNVNDSITSWQSISGIPSTYSFALTCDSDKFYTLDANGDIYSLVDTSISWTKISNIGSTLSANDGFYCNEDMIYAGGMLIVANLDGKIYYSSDNGSTWNSTSVDIGTSNYSMVSLTYGNGMFVGCIHGTLCYSSDGKVWTKVMTNNNNWQNVVYRADGGWEH